MFEVFETTAENIIGATDATLQLNGGADENLVGDFLDIPVDSAKNSLLMAEQLGLVEKSQGGKFTHNHPYAEYLVGHGNEGRIAILRLALEQYEPYRTFKSRLVVTGLVSDAATQTKALHDIDAHREKTLNTFLNLGQFTGSLEFEGAGLYKIKPGDIPEYLAVFDEIINERELVELEIQKRIGEDAYTWIDREEVFDHLVTAVLRLQYVDEDSRAPVVHAGNAIESFLVQIGNHHGVNLQTASGINAKVDQLKQQGAITKKHSFVLKYLGHIRNAADHGTDIDPDIGQTWKISPSTSVEYVHVAFSAVTNIVTSMGGTFVI